VVKAALKSSAVARRWKQKHTAGDEDDLSSGIISPQPRRPSDSDQSDLSRPSTGDSVTTETAEENQKMATAFAARTAMQVVTSDSPSPSPQTSPTRPDHEEDSEDDDDVAPPPTVRKSSLDAARSARPILAATSSAPMALPRVSGHRGASISPPGHLDLPRTTPPDDDFAGGALKKSYT